MKSITAILCLVVILMAGCQFLSDRGTDQEGTEHPQNKSDLNLQLKNGEKWEANPETQDGFIKMQNRLTSFVSQKDLTLSDYNNLGEELQVMVNNIVQQCTMKGKGHEELHKLLIPVMGSIKDLKEGNLAVCEEAVRELEKLTQVYFDYFQVSGR